MNTYDNSNHHATDRVAEPVTGGYSASTKVLSIGIPQEDMAMAKELIDRMGWAIYTHPQTENRQQRSEDVKAALANLKGCISLPEDFDYKKEIAEHLEAKYQ